MKKEKEGKIAENVSIESIVWPYVSATWPMFGYEFRFSVEIRTIIIDVIFNQNQ